MTRLILPRPQILTRTTYRMPLMTFLRRMGLMSGVVIALDAGDATSMGTSTQWTDLSGNGNHFFRGTTSAAQASDPTANGTPGRYSDGEYWSVDGGDFFQISVANPTAIENLHKNNAKFSAMAIVWGSGATLNNSVFGTNGNSPSNIGVYWRYSGSALTSSFVCQNGSGTNSLQVTSAAHLYNVGGWNVIMLSVDEANGIVRLRTNNLVTSFTADPYVSPSASAASFPMQIMSRGNGNSPWDNTGRIARFVLWDGVAFSIEESRGIARAAMSTYGI